ncbi:MAG: histidine phosphatase family protein [bacterium]|nr:histidine phosphatase family protein [bacterium]
MPVEIVLVRHAICTGNAAEKISRRGDHTQFTLDIRKRKSVDWPLTPLGVEQSKEAGLKIKEMISEHFDYYITSDILRAVQTAQGLGFGDVDWRLEPLWRERNWGGVENLPLNERRAVFDRLGIPFDEDRFDWRPPRGESMVSILKRVQTFLDWAHRNLSGKRLLIVSHGGPIHAMRVIQHGITSENYQFFIGGNNYVRNCHVFQYFIRSESDITIPKFKFERSLFTGVDGIWSESVQQLPDN